LVVGNKGQVDSGTTTDTDDLIRQADQFYKEAVGSVYLKLPCRKSISLTNLFQTELENDLQLELNSSNEKMVH